MTSVVPMTVPCPPPCPPPVDLQQARDIIDTQQQTIRFLLTQWNAMLAQVGLGTGEFGTPTAYAVNQLVPTGWWQCVAPNDNVTVIGTVVIGEAPATPVTVNVFAGQFWSDGTVTITHTGGVTLSQIGVMP